MLPPGILPFWFWNTAMDAELIRRQLAALAAGGCVGAFIHPRQGYPGGYLSGRWRELVALACREGAARGLAIGICDEFPYPSGNAGGLPVLGRPERWATELAQRSREAEGGPLAWELPAGAVLDCAAFPVADGAVRWAERRDLLADIGVGFRQETYRESARDLSAYNGRRYFACDPTPRLETVLPPGRWLVTAAVQTVATGRKYVGAAADTLDPEAMGAVLDTTLPGYAGIGLRALFVDEIEPAGWSRHLPIWWREATGEALAPLLPALARDDHPRAAAVRERLAAIRRERFSRAFLDPMRGWCRREGVTLCEERPLHRLADVGADIPGCDPGHTRIGAPRHDLLGPDLRRNARGAAAAGRLRDGAALCETGHSLGWGAGLADLAAIVDGLLLHGVTHIIPHAAFASIAALRKHDAPPSFFMQQSWWHLHHLLAARVARIQAAFAGTAAEPELMVPPGTSEDIQHRLMAGGWEWSFADGAPVPDPAALPPPRLAPWWEQPGVERVVRTGNGRRVALVRNAGPAEAAVRPPSGWALLPLDGAAPEWRDGAWRLAPGQALLAEERADAAPGAGAIPQREAVMPERWRVRPRHGNLLRLGRWRLSAAAGGGAEANAEIACFPLSEQLRQGRLAIVPAIDPGFGTPTRFGLAPLACTYTAEFHWAGDAGARLLLERETLVDPGWSIQVNDGRPWGAADLVAADGLCEEALGRDISTELRPGRNRITVRCTTARPDGGLRNPLYLHGAFAVWADARTGTLPASAALGDLAGAGLPTAAGTVEWEAGIEFAGPAASGPLALRLPDLDGDACEAALDDGDWQAVPWAPRRLLLPAWTPGRHRLRIRQHLPLGRSFHAEGWDAAGHRVVPVRFAAAAAAG